MSRLPSVARHDSGELVARHDSGELQYLFDKSEHLVRHVAEREGDPCAGRDYCPGVAERLETVLVVVASHTRISDSAKRRVFVGDVHDHVVDAASS